MRSELQLWRWATARLPDSGTRRLVLVQGARQTGKTTLVTARYPELRYVNFDAIEDRERLASVAAADWARTVGPAVLDEAQKAPWVFEKVKHAFDARRIGFTVLLGSTAPLVLDRVRESLAGRVFLHSLWPLMPSELRHEAGSPPPTPLLDRILRGDGPIDRILADEPPTLVGDEAASRRGAVDHLATWGGMPALLPLGEEDRRDWLRSYQQTFVERDLVDLARLEDAAPFRTFQRLAMIRTGQTLSYASIARDASVAPTTARRWLDHLVASFQTLLLPPYHENLTSEVVKAPKLHWIDVGLLRHVTQQWGPLTGPQFESLVVAEVHKWIETTAADARLSYYRTRSGLEVDLLARTPHGLVAFEAKARADAVPSDARPMCAVGAAAGSAWRGGIVVHTGDRLAPLVPEFSVWAVPLHRLL